MSDAHSDALVFFGARATGVQEIFPALQAMVKRGHLHVPVIGVAKAGWGVDELRARARDSVKQHGGLDARRSTTVSAAALRRRRLPRRGDVPAIRQQLGRLNARALLAIPPTCSDPL